MPSGPGNALRRRSWPAVDRPEDPRWHAAYARAVARYFDVHPDNPQPRAMRQVSDLLRDGGLIAYPTDSCFALGSQLGNRANLDRIRSIRGLDERHHFTLVCKDFAQLGQFVQINTAVFRLLKSHTPGRYTFILPATSEVPRRLMHPKQRTVGIRIPGTPVVEALLGELGEPLVSSTLLMPDERRSTDFWLGHQGTLGQRPRRGRRLRRLRHRADDRRGPLGRRAADPAPRRRGPQPVRVTAGPR